MINNRFYSVEIPEVLLSHELYDRCITADEQKYNDKNTIHEEVVNLCVHFINNNLIVNLASILRLSESVTSYIPLDFAVENHTEIVPKNAKGNIITPPFDNNLHSSQVILFSKLHPKISTQQNFFYCLSGIFIMGEYRAK